MEMLPKHERRSCQYHRLARRLEKKKAVVAVSNSLLVIISHVLSTKQPYSDLEADSFEQRNSTRLTQRSVRQLPRDAQRADNKKARGV